MLAFNIGNKKIGSGCPVFIIAEAGVNHNGDFTIAKKMIDVAVEAGVDAIKFQTFKTENLILQNTPKAEYQKKNSQPDENFYDLLKRLELTHENFKDLQKYAEQKKIIFLSTPFDFESAEFLDKIHVPAFKISSGDFDNFPFLDYLITKNKPILISSGMANMDEVKETIEYFKKKNFFKLVLFQCTSSYPTPDDALNLRVINSYRQEFPDIIIGFSDHSTGTLTGSLAVVIETNVIEKHFTLDQNMDGPDHKASLNPIQLKEYVQNIRTAEIALGSSEKCLTKDEKNVKCVARKSIVSLKLIKKNSLISLEDITVKRPGTGIPPKYFEKIIGKKVKYEIKPNSIISWDDFE